MRSHFILLSLAMLLLHTPAIGKTYRCVSFEYPPLVTQAQGARPSGFAVELIELIFKKLDADMTVTLYPWERAMAMMRQGTADCIFTIYRVPERELFIDYSKQIIATQIIHLYARKGSDATFNGDLSLMRGRRVGVVRQINYGPRFERARRTFQIDEAATIEQNFRKLAAGRVDVAPSNLATATSTLALLEPSGEAAQIVQLSPPVEIVPSYLGFSKRRQLTQFRDQFDRTLRLFAKSAEYRRLLEKHRLESGLDLQKALAPALL